MVEGHSPKLKLNASLSAHKPDPRGLCRPLMHARTRFPFVKDNSAGMIGELHIRVGFI